MACRRSKAARAEEREWARADTPSGFELGYGGGKLADLLAMAPDGFGDQAVGVGLLLDAIGPVAIELYQAAAGMPAAELGVLRSLPAHRLLVEDHEVLGWRKADHDLAQPAPFMVGAELHQTRA